MTWAVTIDVPAPVELYAAVHAELLRRTGGAVDGLLVHLARATGEGFQVVEVWESREACERYTRDVVGPVVAELSGGQALPADDATAFEVRGLLLPGAGVAV
ncbi:hypothetical protein [Geodermatophilus sabuli]|uniref:Antibiotic biosynthesis monooxygenase n=1 Tax=Geodermatophilus sabuli TaxID=1564158 RepID=A0A285E8H4_9ACTN|nr:hypothetical protein [Geodermatophilus sabuli]MBB3082618.1 hypothetical protein [Geodermatophilus sabuli]SNX94514.1 hypothetical protein SAMN06893097_101310 [Geodermatophilus sabuli]